MKIKNKMKKIIAIILIFSLSLVNSAKAELTREKSGRYYEKPISYDIKNNFTGFYKNFIIELGGVRLALYDSSGNELWKFDILPKQFADKSPIYELKTDYIESPESIILPYTYKLDLSIFRFSDYIPRLTQSENKYEDNRIPYVHFKDWTDWDEVWYWAEANNCENLIGLLTDLGVYESYNGNKYLNPNTNEEMDFITWFNTTNIDKKTYPSMLFEPLTFYPETTEQIYCSKLAIAGEYGMQWNSDFLLTITEHVQNNSDSEGGILGFFKGIADVINAIVDFFTKTVYYNVGVLEIEKETIVDTTDLSNTGIEGYNAPAGIKWTKSIQEPKMINLTYTDTTTYSCEWKTEGFWKNFEGSKINVELDVSKEKAEAEYKAYELKCKSFNISSIYKNTKEYMESIGYRELSDGNYKSDIHMWEGIGDKSYIRTEHNKYWTWVPLYEGFEIVINTEKMLAGLGILFSEPKIESNTTVYKYGAELFMSKMGVASESEIKIEFHPNGGQLSDEAGNYNKNKIDDSYTKIIKSNEKIKIDKTYSDNFFSDVYSDEHTYTRYNTKADMSGDYVSVDSEKSFTEDTVLLCCGGERSEPTQRIVRTAPTRCRPQTKIKGE
jgi:hypothetical protein